MSKKDQQLIDKNPGKTPHELLALGLSHKGFAELTDSDDNKSTEGGASTKKAKATIIPDVQRAMPQVSEYTIPAASRSDTVSLKDLKTGRVKQMGQGAAEKLALQYPHEFQILTHG